MALVRVSKLASILCRTERPRKINLGGFAEAELPIAPAHDTVSDTASLQWPSCLPLDLRLWSPWRSVMKRVSSRSMATWMLPGSRSWRYSGPVAENPAISHWTDALERDLIVRCSCAHREVSCLTHCISFAEWNKSCAENPTASEDQLCHDLPFQIPCRDFSTHN